MSIVTCATGPRLQTKLLHILGPAQAAIVLDRTEQILTLSPGNQARVRQAFGEMYNTQMYILIGIAAAQGLVALMAWQKAAIVLKK